MLKTSGCYILYVSTFRSTENWSHFDFLSFILEKQETRGTEAHAHDSCIYCTELVMKPHDDLMMSGLHVNTAPSGCFSQPLKGELCSHDVPGRLKV